MVQGKEHSIRSLQGLFRLHLVDDGEEGNIFCSGNCCVVGPSPKLVWRMTLRRRGVKDV